MGDELKPAELFDTKPFRTPRIPQRFVFDDDGRRGYGICWPLADGCWKLDTMRGGALFDSDPWEVLGHVIGQNASSVAWIDNDFGWRGKPLAELDLVVRTKKRSRRSRFDQLFDAIADHFNAKMLADAEICLRFPTIDEPYLELIEFEDDEGTVIAKGFATSRELRRLIDLAIARQDGFADDEEEEEDDEDEEEGGRRG